MLLTYIFLSFLSLFSAAFALPLSTSAPSSSELFKRANVPRTGQKVWDLGMRVNWAKWEGPYALHDRKTECKSVRVLLITKGYKCHTTIKAQGDNGKVYDGGWVEESSSMGLFQLKSLKDKAENHAEWELTTVLHNNVNELKPNSG